MTHWLDSVSHHALADEAEAVAGLLTRTAPLPALDAASRTRAAEFITHQRAVGPGGAVEAFLQSYGLSTHEGIAMMCLAEALLRIPDSLTADKLIDDTFANGDWKQHLGKSESTLVNASSWALMLTGSVLELDERASLAGWFGGLIKRSGEPVIRQALRAGMKFLGGQFVMGETMEDALKRARGEEAKGYAISYDILGEGARTEAQALAYTQSYLAGIRRIAAAATATDLFARPGISVKLSALHPRYSQTQETRVMGELLPRLKSILAVAKECHIAVSLDAEEANRLEIELEVYRALLDDPAFADFDGIGFVLQAYQKRAIHVAEALFTLARAHKRRLPVRLVKGAYWDSEIKHAQTLGLPGYPVFTRKEHTDLSYLACAQHLLQAGEAIYPQFATHNALTVATIMQLAEAHGRTPDQFEFQRLHGMGESLHDQFVGAFMTAEGALLDIASPRPGEPGPSAYRVRIYAPVGAHQDLLAYLIRRLLENGANSSFVHLLLDRATPIDALTESPIRLARASGGLPEPNIPLPGALYGAGRLNPRGIDFGYRSLRLPLLTAVEPLLAKPLAAAPREVDAGASAPLMAQAIAAHPAWEARPVAARAAILQQAGDVLEARLPAFIALLIAEAKKTYPDALAEVREAIDMCRYYAAEAERVLAPQLLPGPTGERNLLTLHGRGAFLCISPWNFPLAIFLGQVAAALVTGNSVIAKPAEQTPRIAAAAVDLLQEAGVPIDVLQLAPGNGETLGAALVSAPGLAGVCFTGSTSVAKHIARALAEKDGAIIPFIAETGGMNAMIVDSSALLEQACDDIMVSAFGSAGQRCSSLRMLFVQEEVAASLRALLCGAMDALTVGDPRQLATDIPPVIDAEALALLQTHIARITPLARFTHTAPAPSAEGTFLRPQLFELDSPRHLTGEVFGPILHLIPYRARELPAVLREIQATGYGLTFGLHTRLRGAMEAILGQAPVGNRYVNRSMTGAVVGVQPFGGEGLSGTGPKAGGPHYLLRFITERTTSINTAAIGGNVDLLVK